MKWQPDPLPVMEPWQRDSLRDYILANDGWGGMPPIIVDEDGNLIDGFKRAEVYTVIANAKGWPLNCPATVIQGGQRYPDESERATAYARLRRYVNHRTVVVDEIEEWLASVR